MEREHTERVLPKLALEGCEVGELWLLLLLLVARPLPQHYRIEEWWKGELFLPILSPAKCAVPVVESWSQFAALQRRDMFDMALLSRSRDGSSLART